MSLIYFIFVSSCNLKEDAYHQCHDEASLSQPMDKGEKSQWKGSNGGEEANSSLFPEDTSISWVT